MIDFKQNFLEGAVMKKVFGILVLLWLTACQQSTPPPALKIALEHSWVGYLPVIIARERGFFAQHGVDVELVTYSNGTAANQAYEAGETDGVLSVFADSLMMNVRGIPTQAVYVIDSSNTADMIVAKPEFQNLEALRDKIIAFDGINSFSHLFVIKALERVKIYEGQFRAVNLPMAEVLPALESGKIDAGYVYTPESNAALAKGYKTMIAAHELPGIIIDVLTFKPQILSERALEVEKMIQALFTAREWMMLNQSQALDILSKINGIAVKDLEIGFKGLEYPDRAQNIKLLSGGDLFKSGEQIIDFYVQRGQISKKPNLDYIINGHFVQITQ